MADPTPFTANELAALMPRLQATLDLLAVAIQHKLVIERVTEATRQTSSRPGRDATMRPVDARTARKPRRGKASRLSAKQRARLRRNVLTTLAAAKAGASMSDLEKQLKVRGEALGYTLRKLRAEGTVKMTGARNLAKWCSGSGCTGPVQGRCLALAS